MIYLKPDLILYVESCGSHTLLHTSTQTFECVERLSRLYANAVNRTDPLSRKLSGEPDLRRQYPAFLLYTYQWGLYSDTRETIHAYKKAAG